MKIFLTGATGFIGSVLMKSLLRKGHTVHALIRPSSFHKADLSHPRVLPFKGNLLDQRSLAEAMGGCRHAYHMAGYARVWSRDPNTFYRVNVEGTENVLQAAREQDVKKVVFTSSAATLTSLEDNQPVDSSKNEEMFVTEYARSKHLAEQAARQATQDGLPAVIVNPPRVYGPGLLSESNAVTKLVKWYVEGKWRFLPGDGSYTGNYAFVEDVVDGHQRAMKYGRPGERYILGGENVSLKELFELVGKVSGKRRYMLPVPLPLLEAFARAERWKARRFKIDPLITPAWLDNYLKDSSLSSQKAREELGYEVTPIKEALARTVQWVRREGK